MNWQAKGIEFGYIHPTKHSNGFIVLTPATDKAPIPVVQGTVTQAGKGERVWT